MPVAAVTVGASARADGAGTAAIGALFAGGLAGTFFTDGLFTFDFLTGGLLDEAREDADVLLADVLVADVLVAAFLGAAFLATAFLAGAFLGAAFLAGAFFTAA
ncbi:MAG: hypothetical protein ACOYXM_19010, partial [Actinomycetota bacterium]